MTPEQETDMTKLTGDYITEYYHQTRGVGHTQAMMDGVGSESVVIVANHQQARELKTRQPLVLFIPSQDSSDKLRGLRRPLHIDNHAFTVIWAEVREALNNAEKRIAGLESKLVKLRV